MSSNRIVGDFVQIPPVEYEAAFVDFETRLLFGRQPKLYLWFSLITPGYIGIKLPRYYNVLSLSGKPRRGGRFKAGRKGNFVREYGRLFNVLPDLKSDWSERLTNVICKVRVKTCDRSFNQKAIAECAQYSHIAEILEVYDGQLASEALPPLPNPFPAPVPTPTRHQERTG